MIVAIGVVAFCGLVVLLAIRIVLGWVLPARAVAAFDRGFERTCLTVAQVSLVALAGFIVYAFAVAQ